MSRDRPTWVTALIGLYPRAWQARYGAELEDVVGALAAERRGPLAAVLIAVDLIRGAADAHRNRRYDMKRLMSDAAVRRGGYDGLIVAAGIAVVAFLTVVVFPPGPNESDDDPEYLVQIFAAYLILALLLTAIGAHGRRRGENLLAGLKAGAAAGLVIALMVFVTYLVIDNAFFSVVSQQHDKRVAFARSGWTSMRAFVNFQMLTGLFVVTPMATAVGAGLGFLGGALWGRLGRRTASVS
jgi:hypothetical protein